MQGVRGPWRNLSPRGSAQVGSLGRKGGGGQGGAAHGLTGDEDSGGNVGLGQHGLHHCLEVIEGTARAAVRVQQHQHMARPRQHPIAVTWGGTGGSGCCVMALPWEGIASQGSICQNQKGKGNWPSPILTSSLGCIPTQRQQG